MCMRYKGSTSSNRNLPGSTPQGTFLGTLLLIIVFNGGALPTPAIPRPSLMHLKYIDELSVLAAIDLKKTLVVDTVVRPKPLSYNERTSHVLPKSNALQTS